MREIIIALLISISISSCSDSPKSQKEVIIKKKNVIQNIDTIPEVAFWADSVIMRYLEKNKDRLREVDGFPVTYIKDIDIRNNKTYAVARIGHSFEHMYMTDQWIFIDSITRTIYEYDIVNDSLILWKTNH